jgi:hypothetical protein
LELKKTLKVRGRSVPASGKIKVGGREISWRLKFADRSSVSGDQLVLYLNPEGMEIDLKERIALNGLALKIGARVFEDFRLLHNFGKKASTLSSYHVHIIAPAKGEVLVSGTANIPKCLKEAKEKFNLPQEALDFVLDNILQKR